jgi:hypothetical protein
MQKILKTGEHQCFGFDFRAFYLSLLGSCGHPPTNTLTQYHTQSHTHNITVSHTLSYTHTHNYIPTKRGREVTLTELDFYKLEVGMYHVKIQSTDPTFIFQYSKDNIYAHTCLYQAFKCKKEGKNITIELVQDGQPNAYLYGKEEEYIKHHIISKIIQEVDGMQG